MKILHTTPALLLAATLAGPAFGATCNVEIAGNDAMKFDKTSIDVPQSCKQFTVKLTHPGKLAKNVMGHNWVLSKAADVQGIAADGISAGLDKNYLKPGDPRVIAHTKVVGGGESDSVIFDTSKLKAGENYAFFCSFPGHAALMKGTVAVTK